MKRKKKTKKKSPTFLRGPSTNDVNDTTLSAQRKRLLAWLLTKPITTIEARSKLNILAPAARVFELRHNYQFNIVMHLVMVATPEGKKHRVAQYVLMPRQEKEVQDGDE